MEAFLENMWNYVVQIHTAADINALVIFYGVAAGGLCFLILELLHAGTRSIAKQAQARTEDVEDKLDELRRLERRIRARFDEKDEALRERIEEAEERFANRVDRKTDGIVARVSKVEEQSQDVLREMESFRQRVSSVEKRIPDIYDHLEEFRNTLARIFRGELSTVLDSFDSSVAAVLDHMKDELRMGINRIEGIEGMVKSRQKAERALLGPSDEEWQLSAADEETVDAGFDAAILEEEPEEPVEADPEAAEEEEVLVDEVDDASEEETAEVEAPEDVLDDVELGLEDDDTEEEEEAIADEEEEPDVVDQMVDADDDLSEEVEDVVDETDDKKGDSWSTAA